MRSLVLTGAKVVLYVNKNPIARAMEFSWDEATPHKPVFGLDSIEAFELAPGVTTVTGTIQVVRCSRDGGAEGAGLQVPALDRAYQRYVTLMLIDRDSDTTLFQADRCVVLRQQWSAPTRGIVRGVIQFQAIRAQNEIPSETTG